MISSNSSVLNPEVCSQTFKKEKTQKIEKPADSGI